MRNLIILCFLFSVSLGFSQKIDLKTQYVAQKVKRPLIVLNYQGDQVKMKNRSLDGIDPNWIKSIDVLKGNSASFKYGERDAKDGVIILSLKTSEEIKEFFQAESERLDYQIELGEVRDASLRTYEEDKRNNSFSVIRIRGENAMSKKPLLIVQYKDQTFKLPENTSLDEITLERVKTFSVKKDEESLKEYEAIDKSGIIFIELDKTKKSERLFKKLKKKYQ